MLGYMYWLLVFRLRRDRVKAERERTRGKFAFRRPRDRVRFLLKRTFNPAPDKPEWEDALLSSLAEAPADSATGEEPGRNAPP